MISVPMDRVVETIPYEQREVADAELFASFADRVRTAGSAVLCATADRGLLAAGAGGSAAVAEPGPVSGRSPASAGGPLGPRHVGSAAEHRLRCTAICPVRLSLVGPSAAVPRDLQRVAAGVPPRESRPQPVASRAGPGTDGDWREAPFWLVERRVAGPQAGVRAGRRRRFGADGSAGRFASSFR